MSNLSVPKRALRRLTIGNWNFTDDGGANPSTHAIFDVDGDCLVSVFGVCKDSILAPGGATTISAGYGADNAGYIAQVADARNLIIDEVWHDATPDAIVESVDLWGVKDRVVSFGQDVTFFIGAAFPITAGEIVFYALWVPLSADGNVTPF